MIRWRDLPRKLKINGRLWQVFYHRGRVIDEKTGEEIWGFCSTTHPKMHIAPGQPPLDRLDTFFHEFLHAAEIEYGFSVSHEAINHIAAALARLFAENPGLFQSQRKILEDRRESRPKRKG